ncbi:APH(3') family aminoglycoside O-phosphotransferase [Sphingomonas morindae]|uniref:Aminoglycoside 3'-phosphotransferase n=1 Tax=Sphingomonas morindae TaxID=1541170 RepID=A0ABY4XBM1_9SPHN|nr:APH(3') family aminoglycoside O-phosphotransferase [Sphingomonas morindae]USI74349.1 aminoglycoside 3'-phosphotransferase [Sphingomonas morindae]
MDEARERAVTAPWVPSCLVERLAGRRWFRDQVGEAGAAVYRLHAAPGDDLYLKHGTDACADAVTDEMARLVWLAPRIAVPRLRHFVRTEREAWLLTDAVPGRTAWQQLAAARDASERAALARLLGGGLAAWHALPVGDCPFDSGHGLRLGQARARMIAGLVDEDDFAPEHRGWSAAQLWEEMTMLVPTEIEPVVTHGDFSLDNILIEQGRISGYIDVGLAGRADRYQDIAILWQSLGAFGDAAREAFLAAYGLAAPDPARLAFHGCLDEFF